MLAYIQQDSEILERYDAIKQFEAESGGWAYHHLTHVENVATLAEQLLSGLNVEEDFIEETKLAALLHDIGSLDGKANHAEKSYEFAKQYFKRHHLQLTYEASVLHAIKHHSDGFETNQLMTLVLILADKLDIKKDRLAPAGYEVNGLNEIQYIDEITVHIAHQTLYVTFTTQQAFDKIAFENFYFAKKVFKAIQSFSNSLQLNYQVLINDDTWIIDQQ